MTSALKYKLKHGMSLRLRIVPESGEMLWKDIEDVKEENVNLIRELNNELLALLLLYLQIYTKGCRMAFIDVCDDRIVMMNASRKMCAKKEKRESDNKIEFVASLS